jgi:hypothetical protein
MTMRILTQAADSLNNINDTYWLLIKLQLPGLPQENLLLFASKCHC